MATPLNDLVAMLLSPHAKTREDLLPYEQMLGIQPMQQGMNAAVNGPLGQLAQMVQARKSQEEAFRKWYGDWAQRLGLNPNPDDPQHHYDYRATFAQGIEPQPYVRSADIGSLFGGGQMMPDRAMERAPQHWPSTFKQAGHPNLIVNGIDTRTGQPVGR